MPARILNAPASIAVAQLRQRTATVFVVPLARVKVWGRPAALAAIGCVVFALGLLVYLMDRDASKAALIPSVAWLAGSNVFGALGGWLPSFAHTFAFSLFTAAVLPECGVPRYGACVAWFAVNVAFELGQHPQLPTQRA